MRAYRVEKIGDTPQMCDIPRPQPEPGQTLVRMQACGLNFADLLMIEGKYQDMPSVPFTLGMEVAGIVETADPSGNGPPVGSRVVVFGGRGGLADYGVFATDRLATLPDTMPFADAAAMPVAYGTSHVALNHKARLQPGETLLVLGAAGGVGLTAVEVGKLMGARVIACARGADKLAVAKQAGADHLIDAKTEDIRETVKALGGADVVYDPVGGDQFEAAFRAMRPEGRMLVIGFASGRVPEIKANHMLVKNIDVLGFYWGAYRNFRPDIVTDSMHRLMAWYDEGRIRPHVSNVLSLDNAAEGLELLRTRQSTGKVIVTP